MTHKRFKHRTARRTKKTGGATTFRTQINKRQQDNELQLKHALEAKLTNYTSGYAGWGEDDQRIHMAKDIHSLRTAYKKCINKPKMSKVSVLETKVNELETEVEELKSGLNSFLEQMKEMRYKFAVSLHSLSINDFNEFSLLSINEMLWILDEDKENIAQLQDKYKEKTIGELHEMIKEATNGFGEDVDQSKLNNIIALYNALIDRKKETPDNSRQ